MRQPPHIRLAVFALAFLAPACANVSDLDTPLASDLPALSVALAADGARVVEADGAAVMLRGVNLADPLFMATVDAYPAEDTLEPIQAWGATVVRLPIYPDLWIHAPDYLARYVDPVVIEARRRGLYVILGWHGQGDPLTGRTLVDEDQLPPWRGPHAAPSPDLAVAALTRIADRYKACSWVVYSVFSEPAYLPWSDWRPVAERLVDAVRRPHPEALVLVPGVNWGYDLSGAITEPVRRENVVYETHPYPRKGTAWMATADSLRRRTPVWIGEWGDVPPPMDTTATAIPHDFDAYAETVLSYAEMRRMPWLAWVWHDAWTPSLVTSLEAATPTAYGERVRDALAAPVRAVSDSERLP